MNTVELIGLGVRILQMMQEFHGSFAAVRATMNEQDQAVLDELLNEIHAENMKLSSVLDVAAREAEKRT